MASSPLTSMLNRLICWLRRNQYKLQFADLLNWVRANLLSWKRTNLLNWGHTNLLSWGRTNLLSWGRTNLLNWGHTNLLSWKRTNLLNWRRTNLLSWGRTTLLNWRRTNLLNWRRTNLLNWGHTNLLNWRRTNLLNWARTNLLNWARTNLLNWRRTNLLNWARTNLLNWRRTNLLSWGRTNLLNWGHTNLLNWARTNLFNSWSNGIVTVLIAIFLAWLLPAIYGWAIADAILTITADPQSWWGYSFTPDSDACRVAKGACWDFITEKFRIIVFGLYPQAEHWRPLLMMIMLVTLIVVSLDTSKWSRPLVIIWLLAVPTMFILMQGGGFPVDIFGFTIKINSGLTFVETDKWGGLPVTLILAVISIMLSFPIAILLALGRQSDLPVVKTISIFFIEIIRGVPLITILFMASLMIPLFLPEGMNVNKLLRALIGFTLFSAAYVAEVIRGGLQAIPKGQYEAADAMGLSYWQKTVLIILPQALKLVITPTMNTFIGLFKDTTLIIIISMFDFLGTIRLGASDPIWRPYYVEGLVFAAVIYFIMCYAMAAYSRHLEERLNTERR